jgi:integrase
MPVKIIRKSASQPNALHQAPQAVAVPSTNPLPADAPIRSAASNVVQMPIEKPARTAPPVVESKESWDRPGVSPRPPARTVTLATVLMTVGASDLTPSAKRDMSWAIRTFARATGRTPSDILAEPKAVRDHLTSMSPAMLGLAPSAFYNVKALLRKAMRLTGRAVRPRSRNRSVALDAQWAPLFSKLPGRRAKARLGGFIAYCSAEKYAPADIETGHVQRHAHVLESEGIDPKWAKTVERTVHEWNKMAEELEFWPKAKLATPWKPKKAFTPLLEEFSEAYQQSVKDYLSYLQNPPIEDELAPIKGLRPGSIRTRLFLLRYMAAVLRTKGWSDVDLSSVNSLVSKAALDILLQHKSPEPGGSGSNAQYVLRVVVLKSIAKYWAAAPRNVIDSLSRVIGRYAVKTHAMAPVNRRKLNELSSLEVRAKLLSLATRVFKALGEVKSQDLKARDAALALSALYVELACMWPGRVGTLSKIHLTKNIVRSGHGRTERVFLHFVAGEIKTNVPVDVELPPHLVAFLDLFLTRYRHLLLGAPSEYLFPARNGGPRSCSTIYRSVTSITRRFVGVPINPHLFRHLTATMFLERRPGDYETVRRTLTHTSLDQAHQSYIAVDDRAAVRRFDEVILEAKEEALSSLRRGRTRAPATRSAIKSRKRK